MNSSLLLIVGFVTATAFSMALIPVVLKFAGSFQLFDRPDLTSNLEPSRKIHTTPIPRLGGIAIVLSFMFTQTIWVKSAPFPGILAGGFAIFLLGLADDILSIRPSYRFVIQCLIAGFSIYYHNLAPTNVNLGGGIQVSLPYWLGFAFSIFIVVGSINTINMIDGLDGLAGGLTLIGVSLLSFLYFLKNYDIGLILFIACPMVGAIIGFLRYNTHPAVIFMGDSGSNWLGFMLGSVMLILICGKQIDAQTTQVVTSSGLPLMSVILCVAIPIFDTAIVMAGRLFRGINPMKADNTHLHHALLKLGLSQIQAVSALYFLGLCAGVLGILPVAFPNYGLELTPYIGIIIVFSFVILASRINTEISLDFLMQRAKIRETTRYKTISIAIRYWENFNRYLLYVILLAGPAFAGNVRRDVGIAAATVFLLIIASIILSASKQADDFLDSTCIALAATVLLIANNANTMMVQWQSERVSIHPLYNFLFGVLLVSTILLFLVTAKKRYFIFKPSDFLLATIPLLL
ncbi:MAG: MraY family glycosyltransferase, partial [Proteobacteria bacterium]|nr:MraY family glycosyltransferase [Pseudomonadota bacterium]